MERGRFTLGWDYRSAAQPSNRTSHDLSALCGDAGSSHQRTRSTLTLLRPPLQHLQVTSYELESGHYEWHRDIGTNPNNHRLISISLLLSEGPDNCFTLDATTPSRSSGARR